MIKLLVIASYFLVIFMIGAVASKKIKTSKDFILGNREFNALTTALGAGAADMGAWVMMGFPGLAYSDGMSALWLPIGLTIGAYLNWQFVAVRLRVETHKYGDALTIPGYLSNKLNDSSGRIKLIISAMTTIFFVIYIASALLALALLISTLTNIEYLHCLVFSASFIFLYTSIGGFVALNWVDVFQGSLMLFALLIVPASILIDQPSLTIAYSKIKDFNINMDPFLNTNAISIISSLSWGLGYFGMLHILMRFMATKNPNTLKLSKNICMIWMVLSMLGALCVGLFGKLLFNAESGINRETIFLLASDTLFPEWLAGIVLAAVFSAIISSVSAQLHVTASSITEDLLPKFFSINRNTIWITRVITLAIILISSLYIYNYENTVLGLVSFAWAGLGSAFGPAILFTLYSKKMTRDSALYGIATGGLVVLIWHFCKEFGGIFELYEIIPGFLLSSVVIMVKNDWSSQRKLGSSNKIIPRSGSNNNKKLTTIA